MADFGPVPSEDGMEQERERWRETRDTRQRVTEVVAGLHDPASVAEVADLAACSANAARKHLADLVDLGVVRTETADGGTRYRRNDEYFRWRRANELAADGTVEELHDRLSDLEDRDEAFRQRYDAPGPETVSFHDDADHETIHAVRDDLGEWATVRREMAVLKDAIRMAERSRGGELTA